MPIMLRQSGKAQRIAERLLGIPTKQKNAKDVKREWYKKAIQDNRFAQR